MGRFMSYAKLTLAVAGGVFLGRGMRGAAAGASGA